MKNSIILTIITALVISFFFSTVATAQTVDTIYSTNSLYELTGEEDYSNAVWSLFAGHSSKSRAYALKHGAKKWHQVDKLYKEAWASNIGKNYKLFKKNGGQNLYLLHFKRTKVESTTVDFTEQFTIETSKEFIDTVKSITITVEETAIDTLVVSDTSENYITSQYYTVTDSGNVWFKSTGKEIIEIINLEPLKVQVEYTDSNACTECSALEAMYFAAKIKQRRTNRSTIEIPLSHKTALAYNKYARCASLETINLGRRPKRVSKWLWNSNSWFARQILRVKSHAACRKV